MGTLKVKDPGTGSWLKVPTMGPTGPIGLPGPPGPTGSPGVSSVIIGDFGAITTPADLPVDGLIPVDWDGPGNPAVAHQMELGHSLYYEKPGDPLDGHLFQYVSNAVDPAGWLDIGLIQGPAGPPGPDGPPGPEGPMGGPLPLGGLVGELLVKTGPADQEVGWTQRPRLACRLEVAEIVSSTSANAFFTLCTGPITINPDRWYHFMAGVRCIQDPGQGCFANLRVVCGSVTLVANDVIACTDPNAYWGAWSQNWLRPGSDFTVAIADLTVKLEANLSVASKKFYAPRLYVIEF